MKYNTNTIKGLLVVGRQYFSIRTRKFLLDNGSTSSVSNYNCDDIELISEDKKFIEETLYQPIAKALYSLEIKPYSPSIMKALAIISGLHTLIIFSPPDYSILSAEPYKEAFFGDIEFVKLFFPGQTDENIAMRDRITSIGLIAWCIYANL